MREKIFFDVFILNVKRQILDVIQPFGRSHTCSYKITKFNCIKSVTEHLVKQQNLKDNTGSKTLKEFNFPSAYF